uniref:Large ribosomal subunit protein bL20c n=1 Tax=Lepocinclis steinii TaxID=459226 RepID=A0A3G3LLP3_9EUGL|nr:ribosomal protein L20 [Lepocinclis steinii]AYQ93632.1 ribosomal protein L20 [Lepocinclis steinii]
MSRTKTGFITKKRHKKIIKFNKGYTGSHSRLFKVANQENMHSLSYAYADRRKKKSYFRRVWIKQINNKMKIESSNYNSLVTKLKLLKVDLNRKILAKLSIVDEKVFNVLLKK